MSLTATHPPQRLLDHGLPMSRSDYRPSGFTAVNGERYNGTAFRPEESDTVQARPSEPPRDAYSERAASPAPYRQQRWRAENPVSRTPQQDGDDARKRKRSISKDGDPKVSPPTESRAAGTPLSPKRRATIIDSAIAAGSPSASNHVINDYTLPRISSDPTRRRTDGLPLVGHPSREQSPTIRKDHGEIPPDPPPEVVAGLAESLQRELRRDEEVKAQKQAQARAELQERSQLNASIPTPSQDQNASHAQSHPSIQQHDRVSTPALMHSHVQSPPPQSVDGCSYQQPQGYSPDQVEDPKKRKRNFSNRTKTGCHTCRSRKKKCDERKPTCANCERGQFNCEGYGPKPPGGFKQPTTSNKAPVTLQSKPLYEGPQGPTGYYPNHAEEHGRPYSHWGRIPPHEHDQSQNSPPVDPRQVHHPPSVWPKQPSWPPAEPVIYPPRLPPTDFSTVPPLHPYAHGAPPPLPPPPPPPPHMDTWSGDHPNHAFRPPPSAGGIPSAQNSHTTSSSQRTAVMALTYNPHAQVTEKEKMLLGQPFLHFIDPELMGDRQQCKGALERYNDGARSTSHLSHEERGRLFRAIVDPTARPEHSHRHEPYSGPQGYAGRNTVVESPFTCECGYNIDLGDDVVIQSGCHMQDACAIRVGARTIVGPNVMFYGITASVDASARKGSQGCVQGGAIKIGEDCFIGGDVVILPYRKIGKGAVVGAGSVVTKDVKDYTVVAGNPAKVIRRIEPGPNVDRHHPDIQEQNEKMLQEMWDNAKRTRE
ncbi:hypothetical protein KC324_g17150 [Hortaea werneckii]|nr:hypothetical protein KC324_g17150 [Hortaea werneckii]